MDTTESPVHSTLDDGDPLGSFASEDRIAEVVSAAGARHVVPAVAEVATIHAVPPPRAPWVREGFRARLRGQVKGLHATARSRWTGSQNRHSVGRLKTVRVRREVSRWSIRYSIFAVGVAVGALTASPGSRSGTSSQVPPPSAASEPAVVRPIAGGSSPVAVGTALVGPPHSPVPAPAVARANAEAPRWSPGHRGTLIVTSQPGGASVFVNNRLAGRTPLVMNALPAGSRAVRLSLDGYAAWSRGVSVVANQATRITAKLDRTN